MTAAIMIQLITGAIGSVGFGILFHIKKKYLPLAAVGGFLSWLVFLLGKEFWGNVFLPTLMAGFVTDVYAEILARICKETSTSFFVTSVIPLIPVHIPMPEQYFLPQCCSYNNKEYFRESEGLRK